VLTFFVCAVAHGVAFLRWFKLSSEEKKAGWPFYGWFCCNAFLSSIFGCAAYASRLVSLHLFFTANSIGAAGNLTIADKQLVNEQLATVLQCTAAFYFLFPFELGFSIIAKLLVLHRMKQFAMSKSLHPRRWLLAGRVLVALTVVCISVGILGNIPTAIHYSNSGDLFRQTATAYSQRNLALANDLASQASEKASNGDSAASIQRFSEVIALLAIITAFCIVTLSSLQIIGVALRYLITKSLNSEQQDAIRGKLFAAASEQGNALHRKVTLTFIFIFCTVLVRSIFTTLYALAQALQDSGSACASISSYCDPCLNVYSHIMGWIVYTPLFQQVPRTALKPLPLRACLVAHTPAAVHAGRVAACAHRCAVGHVRRSRH
jgi:ABC-type multidrug transport system fused ATPase/permease subunit